MRDLKEQGTGMRDQGRRNGVLRYNVLRYGGCDAES